jgi:hypothetical protein
MELNLDRRVSECCELNKRSLRGLVDARTFETNHGRSEQGLGGAETGVVALKSKRNAQSDYLTARFQW